MTRPELRPVVLVRQLRLCGTGVVVGVVVATLDAWLGLTVVALSVLSAVALVVRFRRT